MKKKRNRRRSLPQGRCIEVELGCLVRESVQTVEPAGHVMGEKSLVSQTYRITKLLLPQPEEGVEEREIRCGACGAALRVHVASRSELLRSGCLSTLWIATGLATVAGLLAVSQARLLQQGWFILLLGAGVCWLLFHVSRKVMPFVSGSEGLAMAAVTLVTQSSQVRREERQAEVTVEDFGEGMGRTTVEDPQTRFKHEVLSARTRT